MRDSFKSPLFFRFFCFFLVLFVLSGSVFGDINSSNSSYLYEKDGVLYFNESALNVTIDAVSTGVDDYSWLYFFGLLMVCVFFVVGRLMKDRTFVVLSGFLLVIIALALNSLGVPGLSSFLVNASIICFAGIGFYLILAPFFLDKFGMED